jgi:hypothetical protein
MSLLADSGQTIMGGRHLPQPCPKPSCDVVVQAAALDAVGQDGGQDLKVSQLATVLQPVPVNVFGGRVDDVVGDGPRREIPLDRTSPDVLEVQPLWSGCRIQHVPGVGVSVQGTSWPRQRQRDELVGRVVEHPVVAGSQCRRDVSERADEDWEVRVIVVQGVVQIAVSVRGVRIAAIGEDAGRCRQWRADVEAVGVDGELPDRLVVS